MLGLVTTLVSIEVQPTESRVQLVPSTGYLINCSNIHKMKVYDTTHSLISYKFDKHEDRTYCFSLFVDESNSDINTLANVAPTGVMVALPVFEGCQSFSECAGVTATTKYFVVEEISWCEDNTDNTITKMWVQRGGWGIKAYFVNKNINQLYDFLTTGTTTTTTSTTSTTTTTH